ncbi:hypothetical protein TRFO_18843 [Tritrichomonas foetus]|uniref:VPS9 domain-containing protein n=1 Tax=Tritrichomonas foetus TaxID=1144522 RepID=A0A1J4KKD6_9EUKA|nr:hypothetical protein TRFO_18843 [Tritrichomonas foetus]|eukprot:OHT11594.1 hypothetical protein TRFO_18843 [Tritrichomonas foetus]
MTVASLVNFHNLNLPSMMPKEIKLPSILPEYSSSVKRNLSRLVIFFTKLKYDVQLDHFNHYFELCNKLIELFQNDDLLPPYIECDLKETLFYCDALTPDKRIEYIDSFLTRSHDLVIHKNRIFEQNYYIKCVNKVIEDCKSDFDQKKWYLLSYKNQDSFDKLLLGHDNEITHDVFNFLGNFISIPRNKFTETIIMIYQKMVHSFQFENPISVSIFSILYIRAIFSSALRKSPEYFFPKDFENEGERNLLETVRQKLTIQDLSPPKDLLPENIQSSDLVFNVFKEIDCFVEIGKMINFMNFYSNPFDMLNEITNSLHLIECYVSNKIPNEGGSVLPFETVFSLFFGSLLTSDLIEIKSLVQFLEDFTPKSRISPSFEYSRMTFTALYKQINTFAKNLK